MLLIFENYGEEGLGDIVNMENIISIDPIERVEDEVKIEISTNAVLYHPGEAFIPEQTFVWNKKYIIKTKKWLEFIEAIKQGHKVFAF